MIILSFLVLHLLGGLTEAFYNLDDPLENPDLFEGDIEIDEDSDDRSAVISEKRLWPNGTIPFVLKTKDLNNTVSVDTILAAIKEYNSVTCLKFVPRKKEKNYIRFITGIGCHTRIGYREVGEQQITLGKGCDRIGTVLHEIGHAIGFYHEHTRSDRHKYVQILWENVMPGKEIQFEQRLPGKELLLSPFDFDSIMLYGSYTFSKEKNRLKTMVSFVKNRKLPNVKTRTKLSSTDIMRTNKLYGCDKL